MSEIGPQIRRLRKEKDWSVAQLAVYAGMSPSAVSQIETGRRSPTAASMEKLAKAIEVEVQDLFPKVQAPLPDRGEWRPSLRRWIDFASRMADRWEAEFEEREAEWQAAEPHIRKIVKRLPNLRWATEIRETYTNILKATNAELNYGFYVYETAEVQELFRNTQRLEEIVERTEPWYQGEEAPRMAEVIDLQRAMAERVEKITARSRESA